MTVVASFEGVTKQYRRGRERGNLRAALPGTLGARLRGDLMTALDDVTLEVAAGEAVGVIGRNGAGKSTLLKLLAGVVQPTRGRLVCHGRVASLIELGVGFHPDLTGAENVAVGAALLGLSRRELQRKWDGIVAFAGVEQFLDTPVKRYSSGMRARLGFALASHVDAEVLAVDEVLAVGDADFQHRCFERCRMLVAEGVTLVLVSHNLWAVAQICGRVVRLQDGRVADDGSPLEVIERHVGSGVAEGAGSDGVLVRVDSLEVRPPAIPPAGGIDIGLVLRCQRSAPTVTVDLSLLRPDGRVIAEQTITGLDDVLAGPGTWSLRGRIASLPLAPGRFIVAVTARDRASRRPLSRVSAGFEVTGRFSMATRLAIDTDWQITPLVRHASTSPRANGSGWAT